MARRKPGADAEDFGSLLPLHHQIYLAIRQKLLDGAYPLDQPIPGEHHLSAEFGVSRVTIRRTLARLDQDGLIDRRHGVGTFPQRSTAKATPVTEQASYFDYLTVTSARHNDKLLEFAVVPRPFAATATERFGRDALKVVRLSSLGQKVVHILRSYVPSDLAALVPRRALGNLPLLDLLQRNGDIKVVNFVINISAVAADAEEARLLGVAPGAPLVRGDRRAYDATGRLIEYHQSLSRPDRFSYQFAMDAARTGQITSRRPKS